MADDYDPVRGVVDFAGSRDRVKPDCAPIDATARENPHVAFFLTRNPGYQRGDEFVCLAEMRVRDLLYGILRAAGTQVRLTFRRLRTALMPWRHAGARL